MRQHGSLRFACGTGSVNDDRQTGHHRFLQCEQGDFSGVDGVLRIKQHCLLSGRLLKLKRAGNLAGQGKLANSLILRVMSLGWFGRISVNFRASVVQNPRDSRRRKKAVDRHGHTTGTKNSVNCRDELRTILHLAGDAVAGENALRKIYNLKHLAWHAVEGIFCQRYHSDAFCIHKPYGNGSAFPQKMLVAKSGIAQ